MQQNSCCTILFLLIFFFLFYFLFLSYAHIHIIFLCIYIYDAEGYIYKILKKKKKNSTATNCNCTSRTVVYNAHVNLYFCCCCCCFVMFFSHIRVHSTCRILKCIVCRHGCMHCIHNHTNLSLIHLSLLFAYIVYILRVHGITAKQI